MPPYFRSIRFVGVALVALVCLGVSNAVNAAALTVHTDDEDLSKGYVQCGERLLADAKREAGHRERGDYNQLASLTVVAHGDDRADHRHPMDIEQAGDRHDGGATLDVWRIRASDHRLDALNKVSEPGTLALAALALCFGIPMATNRRRRLKTTA